MIKWTFGLLFLVVFSCGNAQREEASIQEIDSGSSLLVLDSNSKVDTLWVDPGKSMINWKGTKMRGLGSHSGEIKIRKGYVLKSSDRLFGGLIEINMKSIEVTDIPITDPIPKKRLTDHLKDPDFFNVEKYPTARIEILKVRAKSANELEVLSNLTIKGITKLVTFSAQKTKYGYTTWFKIDRFDWEIAFEGSWADRTLVDRDIEFEVNLALINSN